MSDFYHFDNPIGWFMGEDSHSQISYQDDWKDLAREDVDFPMEEFRIARGKNIIKFKGEAGASLK